MQHENKANYQSIFPCSFHPMSQHFAMRHWAFLFLIPLLANGCTNMLYEKTDWDCRPANDPQLQVFNAARQKDLLIVYNEFSERDKSTASRAYFLYKNQRQVALKEPPQFVSTNLANNLARVPVFNELQTNDAPPLYVVISPPAASFVVCANQTTNLYDLPWYPDSGGKLDRALLSPATATVDVVGGTIIVGGAIYCWLRYGGDSTP